MAHTSRAFITVLLFRENFPHRPISIRYDLVWNLQDLKTNFQVDIVNLLADMLVGIMKNSTNF